MLGAVAFQNAYGWLLIVGIVVSLGLWSRLVRRDERLVVIYIAALASAFVGAKLVYLLAEGWLHWPDPDRWIQLATGKSILGGLLGGYLGVEASKSWLRYSSATGDWFAVITPISLMLGRIGCALHGCCLGQPCPRAWYTVIDNDGVARWPSAEVEFLFNAVAFGLILFCRRRALLPGQLFHLYLIAYGLFRFVHEMVRATPRLVGPFSGYQFAALAVFALGAIGFVRRDLRSRNLDIAPDR